MSEIDYWPAISAPTFACYKVTRRWTCRICFSPRPNFNKSTSGNSDNDDRNNNVCVQHEESLFCSERLKNFNTWQHSVRLKLMYLCSNFFLLDALFYFSILFITFLDWLRLFFLTFHNFLGGLLLFFDCFTFFDIFEGFFIIFWTDYVLIFVHWRLILYLHSSVSDIA